MTKEGLWRFFGFTVAVLAISVMLVPVARAISADGFRLLGMRGAAQYAGSAGTAGAHQG